MKKVLQFPVFPLKFSNLKKWALRKKHFPEKLLGEIVVLYYNRGSSEKEGAAL